MSTKQVFSPDSFQRLFVVGGKGLEHVRVAWPSHIRSLPQLQIVMNMTQRVDDELKEQQRAMVDVAGFMKKNESRFVQNSIPDISVVLKQANADVFRAIASARERSEHLLQAFTCLCPHHAAFPLSDPADASQVIHCGACKRAVPAIEVVRGNQANATSWFQGAMGRMLKVRPMDVVRQEGRATALSEARSHAMKSPNLTPDDQEAIASFFGRLEAKATEEASSKSILKSREAYRVYVAAQFAAIYILRESVSLTQNHPHAPTPRMLIAEYVMEDSLFQRTVDSHLDTIDIWN